MVTESEQPSRPSDEWRRVRIVERDEAILRDHVGCYRLTTYAALHRLFWPKDTLSAAKSWVRRMRESGLLASAPLYGRTRYFHATPRAAQLVNLDPRVAAPRKAAYIATTFGHLAFCCLGDETRRKLSVDEFKREFSPLVLARDANDGYYLDQTLHLVMPVPEQKRLGLIFVDDARSLKRIPLVLNRLISQRLRIPSWKNDLMRQHRFVIAVVTTSTGKAAAIQQTLRGLHPDVVFRVEPCPVLRNVIYERSPHHAAER